MHAFFVRPSFSFLNIEGAKAYHKGKMKIVLENAAVANFTTYLLSRKLSTTVLYQKS